MQKVQLSWSLYENQQHTIEKYCKNCGCTTLFTDTNIRRHNANGKNIYRFAIYKCSKDHTWNQKLRIYKSFTDHVETIDMTQQDQTETSTTISITQHKESGVAEITIVLDIVFGSHRIDKALSTYISDWSRTRIVDKIKNGDIQLNGQQMKPNAILSEGDHISICL
ncbi:cytoplasmic protein [Bacillus thuringiensis]|uniref:cytoplasmic protein n=1 Tax=Bacillus thuringiensis TaxID=1428 RepID=UPI000BF2AA87|nr:cytoplasmic protein [Bacillus thuringiensis]HDR8124502.1 cytoplasmic protein [Bacillus cereus]PFN85631.1 cytoplasmic protein [Bacillus thuringiensis]PFU72115.1 cytoplasmic protein [Bacillus thuringiensis]PGY05907.1 cytoplasmic protein [Bacillus thuringiensis]HDR8491100.1 cytoplasmic protein [Bacillus cereus]